MGVKLVILVSFLMILDLVLLVLLVNFLKLVQQVVNLVDVVNNLMVLIVNFVLQVHFHLKKVNVNHVLQIKYQELVLVLVHLVVPVMKQVQIEQYVLNVQLENILMIMDHVNLVQLDLFL